MLLERKRFNYMVNTSSVSSSHKKTYTSAIKPTSVSTFQQDACRPVKVHDEKQNNRKLQELQVMNKRLVQQTAKQFKKLQEDVQRVEGILQQKDTTLQVVKNQNIKLKEQVNKVSEEKKILIEAIFQKDLVIKQYEMKVKQLIEQRIGVQAKTPQKPLSIINQSVSSQTQPLPQTCPKKEYTHIQKQNYQLEDEVYRLKEELFDATNKVKLLTQEFQAYKILKEIETVQEN